MADNSGVGKGFLVWIGILVVLLVIGIGATEVAGEGAGGALLALLVVMGIIGFTGLHKKDQ
jgi:hypothetical protein